MIRNMNNVILSFILRYYECFLSQPEFLVWIENSKLNFRINRWPLHFSSETFEYNYCISVQLKIIVIYFLNSLGLNEIHQPINGNNLWVKVVDEVNFELLLNMKTIFQKYAGCQTEGLSFKV